MFELERVFRKPNDDQCVVHFGILRVLHFYSSGRATEIPLIANKTGRPIKRKTLIQGDLFGMLLVRSLFFSRTYFQNFCRHFAHKI